MKLWSVKNVILESPVVVVIPPPFDSCFELKNTSLTLVPRIGSSIHPDPFPPVTPIEVILSISKDWESTNTSSTTPLITGWTKAFVPSPEETFILGGLITS